MAEKGFGFSEEDAKRIGKVVRHVEQTIQTSPSSNPRRPLLDTPIIQLAKSDGTISADASGTVSIWRINDAGSIVDSTVDTTAYDWLGGGASASESILLFRHQQSGRDYFIGSIYDWTARADSGADQTVDNGDTVDIQALANKGLQTTIIKSGTLITIEVGISSTQTLHSVDADTGGPVSVLFQNTVDIQGWSGKAIQTKVAKVGSAITVDIGLNSTDTLFSIAGDSGTPIGINFGDTVTFDGIGNLSTQIVATDKIEFRIADAYLFNDGDSGTGVYNFGAAASFEIPNSSSFNPTITGQIGVETSVVDWSHGILEYYGGETLGVVAMPLIEFASPIGGYVVAYNATNDEFELVANDSSDWTIDADTYTSPIAAATLVPVNANIDWVGGNGIGTDLSGTSPNLDLTISIDDTVAQQFVISAGSGSVAGDTTLPITNHATNNTFEHRAGTGIKLTGDAANAGITYSVLDNYLFNTGDVGTGVYDFGAATSFEIPNADDFTPAVTGEIGVDSLVSNWSHGILEYYGGEALSVLAMPTAVFESPTADYVPAWDSGTSELKWVANSGTDDLWGFKLAAAFNSGTATADKLNLDATWTDTTLNITVRDVKGRFDLALSGAFGICVEDSATGQFHAIWCQTMSQAIEGLLDGESGGNLLLSVDGVTVLDGGESPGTSLTVRNENGYEANDNTAIRARYDGSDWQIYWIKNVHATSYKCLLTTAMASTDATVNVDNQVAMDGKQKAVTNLPTAASNTFKMAGSNNANALIQYNGATWDVTQVE